MTWLSFKYLIIIQVLGGPMNFDHSIDEIAIQLSIDFKVIQFFIFAIALEQLHLSRNVMLSRFDCAYQTCILRLLSLRPSVCPSVRSSSHPSVTKIDASITANLKKWFCRSLSVMEYV